MPKLRNASAILCLLVYFASAWGQADASEIRLIRVLDTDNFFDVGNIDGVVFPPRANSVLVLDQPVSGAGTLLLVPYNKLPGDPQTRSVEMPDPINITINDRGGKRVFLFEPEPNELHVTKVGGKDKQDEEKEQFMVVEYSVGIPLGIAVDPKYGTLFILDGVGPKIVRVDPGPNQKEYAGAAALQERRGRHTELVRSLYWKWLQK